MKPGGNRTRIVYRLSLEGGEDARAVARAIALEQTVELPEGSFPAAIEQRIVGEIEAVEPLGPDRARAVIAYDATAVGDDLLQMVNLLFGNISLMRGIRVESVRWPDRFLKSPWGPRLGIDGLRDLCGSRRQRPLVCAALKPIGRSSRELAAICRQFALGGVDFIKDDHGLADQSTAPFEERVARCQDAVEQANRESGGRTRYFPNVLGGAMKVSRQVEWLRSSGCRGVLMAPFLAGFDTLRRVGRDGDLAVLAHPSLAGAFLAEGHGIAPEVLLGQLFRISGADGVIYPNAGGRFPFTVETCEAINGRLREPLGLLRPAFPVPAGGIDVERVPYWIDRYGQDTVFLIGGSLYAQPDLERATRCLMAAVRRRAAGG